MLEGRSVRVILDIMVDGDAAVMVHGVPRHQQS